MSVAARATVRIPRHQLRAGPLLAEGGEGRVYELLDQPGALYKAYRRHPPVAPLDALIAWRAELAGVRPDLAQRVAAASSWPTAVVTEPGAAPGTAAGLLLPRAPRRFSLRHRDGQSRLATLSYLTTDPGQRAAAYGLSLPPPLSVERIGIVYALARLLEAFQAADPAIGHGDLSTKNVLWSLERGPEVYVLDCDSCERYGADAAPLDAGHRRRAMTPNWDDPAIPSGANPTLDSDRYSLGLIFLRVVGAAHFPVQARQRAGEGLTVELGVPAPVLKARCLAPGAPLWKVCARSLSAAEPGERPGATEWVGVLEELLDDLGASRVARSVWAAQGGGAPSPVRPSTVQAPGDVVVRPVEAAARPQRFERSLTPAPPRADWRGRGAPSLSAAPVPAGGTGTGGPGGPALVMPTVSSQLRLGAARAASAWVALHRAMLRALFGRGTRRRGVGRLLGCAAVDFALLVVAAGLVGMLISPWLGI